VPFVRSLMRCACLKPRWLQVLRELFDKLDKNGDGRVSSAEWGKAVGANKQMLSKYFGGETLKEIGQLFKELDVNGDGSLSWGEFEAAAVKRMQRVAGMTEAESDNVVATSVSKAAIEKGIKQAVG